MENKYYLVIQYRSGERTWETLEKYSLEAFRHLLKNEEIYRVDIYE